jgi:hypothetical protein
VSFAKPRSEGRVWDFRLIVAGEAGIQRARCSGLERLLTLNQKECAVREVARFAVIALFSFYVQEQQSWALPVKAAA